MTRAEWRIQGRLIIALAYASETRTLFLWLGARCWAFAVEREGPSFTGVGRWSW